MTPIEKNIIVVDEQGNHYEATYPKRARMLVKNGRARFIDDNTICLACPPKIEMEDNKMSENKLNNDAVKSERYTLDYCLEQIEKIMSQTEYIHNAIAEVGKIPKSDGPNDISGAAKGEALAGIIKCRETTNQKLLAFYEKMYDELKPAPIDPAVQKLEKLQQFLAVSDLDNEQKASVLRETIQRLF